jgi:hypothetical protein
MAKPVTVINDAEKPWSVRKATIDVLENESEMRNEVNAKKIAPYVKMRFLP